jgi:hypothetical protein
MNFPAGRLKFTGTLAFPANKYLVLRLGGGPGGALLAEDVFENMVRSGFDCGMLACLLFKQPCCLALLAAAIVAQVCDGELSVHGNCLITRCVMLGACGGGGRARFNASEQRACCLLLLLLLLGLNVSLFAQIVFSDAVWVGSPEDNPSEAPLPLPKELAGALLHEGSADYAYGAGEEFLV